MVGAGCCGDRPWPGSPGCHLLCALPCPCLQVAPTSAVDATGTWPAVAHPSHIPAFHSSHVSSGRADLSWPQCPQVQQEGPPRARPYPCGCAPRTRDQPTTRGSQWTLHPPLGGAGRGTCGLDLQADRKSSAAPAGPPGREGGPLSRGALPSGPDTRLSRVWAGSWGPARGGMSPSRALGRRLPPGSRARMGRGLPGLSTAPGRSCPGSRLSPQPLGP